MKVPARADMFCACLLTWINDSQRSAQLELTTVCRSGEAGCFKPESLFKNYPVKEKRALRLSPQSVTPLMMPAGYRAERN